MSKFNINEAIEHAIPSGHDVNRYKARLESLIEQAMLGVFSSEDIKEVIELVVLKEDCEVSDEG